MEIKYYIHGVPYGFHFYGEPEEKDFFFNRYYNKRKDIDEFRIDAVNRGNKQYFYYTYILGKNVIDGQNNRSGSYFGLTIKLDAYYKKATNLYYLLDSFFYSYLYGEILDGNDTKRIFKTQDFNNSKSTIDESLRQLQNLIEQTFSERDLAIIKCKQSDETCCMNVADATDDSVCAAIMKYGHVSISLSHLNNQSNIIKAESDKIIKEITEKTKQDIEAERKKYEELKNQRDKKDAEIERLENKIQEVQSQLSHHKDKSERFDRVISEVAPLINAISNGKKTPKGNFIVETSGMSFNDFQEVLSKFFHDRDKRNKNKWLQLFVFLFSVLSLIFILWYGTSITKAIEIVKQNTEQIEEIPSISKIEEQKEEQKEEQSFSDKLVKNLITSINIVEFKSPNDSAQTFIHYHMNLLGKNGIGEGEWRSDELSIEKDFDDEYYFTAKEPGTYTLQYIIKDTIVAERKIVFKQ